MKHAREDYNRIQDPENRIPEDEPVFLLRGKDVCAPYAIASWIEAAEKAGASPEITKAAKLQIQAMVEWQFNQESKVPDMPEGATALPSETNKVFMIPDLSAMTEAQKRAFSSDFNGHQFDRFLKVFVSLGLQTFIIMTGKAADKDGVESTYVMQFMKVKHLSDSERVVNDIK